VGVNAFRQKTPLEKATPTKGAPPMIWDEELPQKKRREPALGADLSPFSVEELTDYLATLAAERERVEAALRQKQASQQAAHSVFKS
jgi:uncharacterized small protein (DUF1192 family)